MTAWLIFGLAALAAALATGFPLLRKHSVAPVRAEFDVEVFRRQLAEVEADHQRGVLTAEEAAAAKTEVERRILLAADAGAMASDNPRSGAGRLGLALVVIGVPAISLALYGAIGNPGAPDMPLAERADDPAPGMPADVDDAIRQLAERLKEDPENLQGWLLLGRSYAFKQRYQEAAGAFASAVALAPEDDDIAVSYGEALTFAAGGTVTPAARQQFDLVLARNAAHESARYYSGLAQLQAGDQTAALAVWTDLAQGADPTAPWLPGLAAQIATLSEELGVDAPEITIADAPAPPPEATPAAPGPDASDLEMAAEMTPEEQMVAINSMVARLEGRLIEDPNDPDGWKRLGRAKRVLEDLPGARDAYAKAVEQAPEDLDALGGLAEVEMLLGDPNQPVAEPALEVYRRMLVLDERQPDALWFLGLSEAQSGRPEKAAELWNRLLALLPPGSDEHAMLSERIGELVAVE
jgi:cytochrome c-type biogenesis protein CcmH